MSASGPSGPLVVIFQGGSETKGLWVQASPASLCCVLGQDTFILA